MIRRPPRSTQSRSSAASDVYKRQGKLFDKRYEILRLLGSGGMADVYLAHDKHLERHVALKILHSRYARDEDFIERFRREARNAAGLNQPNIAQIYDRGEAEDTYYIAMAVSYTHLRAHETDSYLVCRLLLEKKK